MPKVSVIIPTYNVEPYLRECMESITHQTLKDIEIICINDGSTDNSLKILKEYADKDNRIILIDKENGGYGIGMNMGYDRATGEYIGILEPDDHVPVNMYGDLYEIARKNDLDFVKADFYRFSREENGNMYLWYNHLSKNPDDYNKVFNPSKTPSAIRFIMNTWSGIYRKEFLDEYGIRHHETPGASFQDNGFYFQTFAFAKRAMIVDKPYYMNRRDNPNSSVNNPAKVYCMNVEYDYIRDILMAHPDTWETFKYMYTFKKFHNYIGTIKRISDEYKLPYIERMSEEFKWAKIKGELDEGLFSGATLRKYNLLISSPKDFYNRYKNERTTVFNIKEELEKTKKELKQAKKVKETVTFRVGETIMYVPHKVKGIIKKSRRKNSGE